LLSQNTPSLVGSPLLAPHSFLPTNQTLAVLLPAAGDRAAPSLGTLVPSLASALGSAQAPLRAAAATALDALTDGSSGLDAGVLLQHFAHVVCGGTGRGRPALVEKLAELAAQVRELLSCLLIGWLVSRLR
jgi:hypothetical protein